jgi:hypothetical protein
MSRQGSNNAVRIEELMNLIEEQRKDRARFWSVSARKGKPHPEDKKFDRERMSELFPGYRDALQEPHLVDLFPRELVLEICKYIECGYAQTNEILFAAGYAPQYIYPVDSELNKALEICRDVMCNLPMPAYVLKPDWSIEHWNTHILNLLGWTQTDAESLKEHNNLNVLKLIFDSKLGIRDRLIDWSDVAYRNLRGFKTTNFLAQNEPWYQNMRQYICDLGVEEEKIWNSVQVEGNIFVNALEYVTSLRIDNVGGKVEFRSLFICPGDFHYPHVAAYLPNDDKTWEIFASLGIPIASQRRSDPHNKSE